MGFHVGPENENQCFAISPTENFAQLDSFLFTLLKTNKHNNVHLVKYSMM